MPPPAISKALIPLKDRLVLSPIEKHIYYRRFPYKLIFHVILVALTTMQVSVVIDSEYTQHARLQFRIFKYILLDSTEDTNYQSFLTIDDYKDHLNDLIESFQNMDDNLYQHYDDSHANFSIGIYYSVATSHHRTGVSEIFPVDIDSGTLGPINPQDPDSLRYWIRVSSFAEFEAINIRTLLNTSKNSTSCMYWNISISYSFEKFSQITAEIKTTNRYCHEKLDDSGGIILLDLKKGNYFVSILVLIFSTISMVLSLKYIYSVTNLYMTTRFHYRGIQEKKEYLNFIKQENPMLLDMSTEDNFKKFLDMNVPWHKLPFSQRLKFFNFWSLFGTIGNGVQMIASVSVILTLERNVGQEILTRDNIFVGFGCFFAWVQLLYYLQYSRNTILLTSTFNKSLTENLVFFGFVAPLFIGLTLLAQSLFYNYDRFETTGDAMRTLISMAAGAIVFDVFDETYDAGLMKQLFLFFYFLLFFTSIQNIFVSIIMEGYDRCSIRKDIDGDDPFPHKSAMKPITKRPGSKTPDISPRGIDRLTLDLEKSHSAIDKGTDSLNVDTPTWISDKNSDRLKKYMSKLDMHTKAVTEKLQELTKAYSEVDNTPFGNDDLIYLQNLYQESLKKLLVRMKRYQAMFDPRSRSF